jgi:hypothetical protein
MSMLALRVCSASVILLRPDSSTAPGGGTKEMFRCALSLV